MPTLTGGTVTPGAEVLVLPPTTTVTNMGPLASDGTMYASTHVSNGALTLAYTNLSGTPISSATQPGWLPATEGFAYDTGLAKYVTAASSTSSIALIASTPSLPITTIASSTQTVTAFALGHGGSDVLSRHRGFEHIELQLDRVHLECVRPQHHPFRQVASPSRWQEELTSAFSPTPQGRDLKSNPLWQRGDRRSVCRRC